MTFIDRVLSAFGRGKPGRATPTGRDAAPRRLANRDASPPPTSDAPGAASLVPTEPLAVPAGLEVAAGYTWRVLLVGVGVVALFYALAYFSTVTVPLAIAVLLSAMLSPIVARLRAWGWHPVAAAAVSLLGLALLIVGTLVGVGTQVWGETPELADRTLAGISQLWDWLASGPLHIEREQVDLWIAQLGEWLTSSRAMLAGWAASAGASVGNFLAGTVTALMATFFFSFQGRHIFDSTVLRLVPAPQRPLAGAAALRGWNSLVGYMRAAVIVALVDAAGVALGAWILGLPLVSALFALTFFAAFIPLVGAVTAGVVAVALALVTNGWISALIMLGVVLLVQQLEGNVLQPLLLGQAAELHPLAVLVGLIVGTVVAGIVGALLSIPILAFASAFVRGLTEVDVADPPAVVPDAAAA